MLLSNIINVILRIGLDPLFPPPFNWSQSKKHLVPDNVSDNNKFELVFDEAVDGGLLKLLY